MALLQEFAELKTQYVLLQRKTSSVGLTKETLRRMRQLKDASEKMAGDTEDKIGRITGTQPFTHTPICCKVFLSHLPSENSSHGPALPHGGGPQQGPRGAE